MLTTPQIAYVSSAAVAGVLLIILLVYLFYRNFYENRHIRQLTYRTLYNLAQKNDYLLLNNYRINIDDKHIGLIDHILISKKYIVLINDFAISGVLSGDAQSEQLANTKRKGTEIVVNPLNYNINLTKRLALFTGVNHAFLRGLVVINNDSYIDVANTNKQFKIIRRKELAKTIRHLDKENLKPLNEDSVVKFIKYLDECNK